LANSKKKQTTDNNKQKKQQNANFDIFGANIACLEGSNVFLLVASFFVVVGCCLF
jgi:uncharacterized membrane protein